MKLFDKIRTSKSRDHFELTEQSAVVVIVLTAIHVDRVFSKEEQLFLEQLLAKSPLFSSNSDAEDKRLVESSSELDSKPEGV